jgi:hypothetical protein
VLLLAGVVVGAFAAAMMGAIMAVSSAADLRNAFVWLLGGFASASWQTVTVFAAGHSERGLHVIPLHTQLEIPPGQIVKVPVRIDVEERPALRPLRRLFAVSVTQGNRAPLDFPGTLWVRPRVPLVPTALLLATVLFVAIIAGRSLLAGQQGAPTSTRFPTLTSTAEITQQLVIPAITQPTATPTVTPA